MQLILTKEGLEMDYDNRNSFGKTYGEHKKNLALTESDYKELYKYWLNSANIYIINFLSP